MAVNIWTIITMTFAITCAFRTGVLYERKWQDIKEVKKDKAWECSWTCPLGCELTIRTNSQVMLDWMKENHLEDKHDVTAE